MITHRFAVFLHCYYEDIALDMLNELYQGGDYYDLYISVAAEFSELFFCCIKKFKSVTIVYSANVGMDILPFLNFICDTADKHYDFVIKLHTKKGDGELGAFWGRKLYSDLVTAGALHFIHSCFSTKANLQIIGSGHFFLSCKRLMLDNAQAVAELQLQLFQTAAAKDFGFFAGTMFAVRPSALMKLALWASNNSTRFAGNYKKDGQVVHALERLFALAAVGGDIDAENVGLLHFNYKSNQHYLQVSSVSQSISQAFVGPLIRQYQKIQPTLERYRICETMLDTHPIQGNVIGVADVLAHYVLVQQFDKKSNEFLPFKLSQANQNKINWPVLKDVKREVGKVSIVIPVFNQALLTRDCIKSIAKNTNYNNFEVVVVDNGSDAHTKDVIKQLQSEFDFLRSVDNQQNLNFALGCNIGFSFCCGEYVVFLNNDTTVEPNWLEPLVQELQAGDCFAAQPQLLYPDHRIQCIGVVFSSLSHVGFPIYAGMRPQEVNANKPRKFNAITAACMAIKAADFISAEGFDPIFINGQEDIDLCLRLKNKTGKFASYVPASVVIHHESKSEGRGRFINHNRRVFVDRWKDKISRDAEDYFAADGFSVVKWNEEKSKRPDELKVYKPILTRNYFLTSSLSELKQQLVLGHYAVVAQGYFKIVKSSPELLKVFWINFYLNRKAYLSSFTSNDSAEVGIFLGRADGRDAARQVHLAAAYQACRFNVKLLGDIPELCQKSISCASEHIALDSAGYAHFDNAELLSLSCEFVLNNPLRFVHIAHAWLPGVLIGMLYKLFWGAVVVIDIDHQLESTVSLNELSGQVTKNNLSAVYSMNTLLQTLAAFDCVTVANADLQRLYGGFILPEHDDEVTYFTDNSNATHQLDEVNGELIAGKLHSSNTLAGLSTKTAQCPGKINSSVSVEVQKCGSVGATRFSDAITPCLQSTKVLPWRPDFLQHVIANDVEGFLDACFGALSNECR